MKNSFTENEKYFAAANGYAGFVSYFDKVFASREYDGIFVLKGGPGTGKSSFMRKMGAKLKSEGCNTEEIYCSSDPKSLDGIICTLGERKAALLDGTAPHERDAKIPGAIDVIINLGHNWDEEWLRAAREEILSLTKEKSDAYKRAYFYLRICGACREEIREAEMNACDAKKLKNKAKNLAESIAKGGEGKEKTRLISSFGRYGKYRLDTLESISESTFSPVGCESEKELFMRMLYSELKDISSDMTVCPSPFDGSIIEAIYLPRERVCVSLDSSGERIELASLASEKSSVYEEGVKTARNILRDALAESERWFAIASDLHFRLEEIYSRAMNFDKNDELYEQYLDKMLGLLKS